MTQKILAGTIAGALCVFLGTAIVGAAGGSMASGPAPTVVMADAVKWTPGTGNLKGVKVAVLSGDPSKAGLYTERLRIPDGAKFPAHWHADTEEVTVISGTLLVGVGDKFDASKLTALAPGSFVSIPARLHHYAMAKGVTVVQINAVGPGSMTLVGGHM